MADALAALIEPTFQKDAVHPAVVARFLEGHPAVAWVSYAGLESHESHALAGKYLSGGFGSVFTFGLKGGFEAGVRLVEGVDLWSHLANVGDTRSLIIHPASTTHRQLTDEQREAAGAGNDVIRLSVGIESIEDLIADLDQALAKGVGLQGQLGRAGGLASGTTVHEVLDGAR